MAVTPVRLPLPIPSTSPAAEHLKPTPAVSIKSLDSPKSLHSPELDLPIPPELPDVPFPTSIVLPITIDGFSPEMQANITAYIEKQYPDANTEFEIETVLDILLHVVGETFTGSEEAGVALSRVVASANAARHISALSWKFLPQGKKHQVYGAVAKYYTEAAVLAASLKTTEQNIIDEYSVLFTEAQLDAVRANIRGWRKIEEACEEFQRTADGA